MDFFSIEFNGLILTRSDLRKSTMCCIFLLLLFSPLFLISFEMINVHAMTAKERKGTVGLSEWKWNVLPEENNQIMDIQDKMDSFLLNEPSVDLSAHSIIPYPIFIVKTVSPLLMFSMDEPPFPSPSNICAVAQKYKIYVVRSSISGFRI